MRFFFVDQIVTYLGSIATPPRVLTFRCSIGARKYRPLWRPSTRYDFEGGQSLKALGSVMHEGPTTRKLQIGVICQALNTEAFTSFYQAYDGTKCYCPPCHHCLFSSTRLSRSCLPMPLGFLRYAGGWHLSRKPRVVVFFFFASPVASSLHCCLYFSVVSLPRCFGCSFFTLTYSECLRGTSLPVTML